MSYANGTPHYNLPQTVGTDKRDWSDTNESFAAIDSAIHTNSEAANNAAVSIAAIQETMTTDEANIKENQEDIAGLETRMTTAESNINTNTSSISTLTSSVADTKQDTQDMISAFNEPTATSTHDYNVGDYFIYNDVLYKCTVTITTGDTIVPNTNCSATNVTTELQQIDDGAVSELRESVNQLTTSVNGMESIITPYNESDSTADNDYAMGDYFVWDNKLYKATVAITAGETLEVGTNVVETNIGKELAADKMYSVQLPITSGETWQTYFTRIATTVYNLVENSGRAPLCKIEVPSSTGSEGQIWHLGSIINTNNNTNWFYSSASASSATEMTSANLGYIRMASASANSGRFSIGLTSSGNILSAISTATASSLVLYY